MIKLVNYYLLKIFCDILQKLPKPQEVKNLELKKEKEKKKIVFEYFKCDEHEHIADDLVTKSHR